MVLTNPDMQHTGILPHHTKWIRRFENLRYIVLDEVHNVPSGVRQPSCQRPQATETCRDIPPIRGTFVRGLPSSEKRAIVNTKSCRLFRKPAIKCRTCEQGRGHESEMCCEQG
jgi:hypothetical protein